LNLYTDENKGKFDMVAACQMAEVGDEELNDVIPREYKPVGQGLRDIGYYIDEKGVKRYGIIPNQNKFEVKGEINTGYIPGSNITSNPRYR
jgi:hypothetical protein